MSARLGIGGGLITDRGLFWALAALSMFGPLSTDMYLPALPSLTRSLHTSVSSANLSLTASVLGIAAGQLVAGSISDSLGRTRPLRVGLVGFTLTSVLCAIAPSIWVLIVVRFAQGLCGGSSIVIARAIVRDLYEGVRAAQMFALLVMLSGLAPILAPLAGGGILTVSSWRGVFLVLAGIGAVILLATVRLVPETLPAGQRRSGELREVLGALGRLLAKRSFAPWVWSFALSFGMLFAWISGGAYVLENVYGISPQLFSVIFAVNALAYAVSSQACVRLVERFSPEQLARIGLIVGAFVSVAALLVVLARTGIWPLLVVLFLIDAVTGVIMPNAVSAAMAAQADDLGSASALIGLAQFGLGAALAPFIGIGGAHDALPMGIAMAVCGVASLGVNVVFRPGGRLR